MTDALPPAALWLPGGLAMAALTLASGFFSGSETALFFLPPEEHRKLARGSAADRAAARLLDAPDRLLAAVLFWNLLVNLTYFVLSVVVAQRLVEGGYPAAAGAVGLGGLAAIILFGEVLPKGLAVAAPKAVAGLVALPLTLAVRAFDPVAPRLEILTRALTRTFWPKLAPEEYLSADDLEQAVEAATATRELAAPERQALRNVLDLSATTAEELMRPRGSYLTLKSPVHRSDLGGRVPAGGFVAVIDDPPGGAGATGNGETAAGADAGQANRVLMLDGAAAVLGPDPGEADPRLDRNAAPLAFLPWCAPASRAFEALSKSAGPAVGVVNEFGETVGIILFDDVVDAVLRPDPSRARRLLRSEPVRRRPARPGQPATYEVAGLTTLRYLLKRLNLPDELGDTEPVTVTGLFLEELRALPAAGDACEFRGLRLTVEDAAGRDVRRVRVERLPPPPAAAPKFVRNGRG